MGTIWVPQTMPGFLTWMSIATCGAPVNGVICGSTPCGCFQVAVEAAASRSSGPSSTAPSDAVSRTSETAAAMAELSEDCSVASVENANERNG